MDSNKKTARIVGTLFITATATAILSIFIIEPILDAPDYLVDVSANKNRMLIGVLLELVLAGAVVGIGVMMFPILRKYNEALALGYVGARLIEGILLILGSISYLSLLTLSRDYLAGAPDASSFRALGTLLLAVRDWTFWLGGGAVVFSLTAVILNYLLYQSKLVPRWLSGWGLIGGILLFASGLMQPFGFGAFGFESTLTETILALPIAVNEMVLAVWLIVKGFNPSAIAPESAST